MYLRKNMCVMFTILSIIFFKTVCAETKSSFNYERQMKGVNLIELIGEGIPTNGEPANIIKKAQSCVVRHVTSGPISSAGALNTIVGRANTASGAGNVIEATDPDGGQLVFNAQVAFSYMWVGRIARAKVIVEAKTDRFRLLVTTPSILYSDRSRDASDLVIATGTGGEQAVEALLVVVNNVAMCIRDEEKKDW